MMRATASGAAAGAQATIILIGCSGYSANDGVVNASAARTRPTPVQQLHGRLLRTASKRWFLPAHSRNGALPATTKRDE